GMRFFFQAEDGIRDRTVTGVQTCALPIYGALPARFAHPRGALWVGEQGSDRLAHVSLERRQVAGGVLDQHARFAVDHNLRDAARSEEHTSELQSPYDLVCRLLLEKKKKAK